METQKEHQNVSCGADGAECAGQASAASAEYHARGGQQLFAGARVNGWMAYLLPILVMAVTDPLVGGYSRATPVIYLCFLISVWIGRRLRSTDSPLRIGGACVLSSVQFFVLTNLATWALGSMYAKLSRALQPVIWLRCRSSARRWPAIWSSWP